MRASLPLRVRVSGHNACQRESELRFSGVFGFGYVTYVLQ